MKGRLERAKQTQKSKRKMEQRQARPEETETNVKQAAAEQDYQECLT
jgi:hypothetical protein